MTDTSRLNLKQAAEDAMVERTAILRALEETGIPGVNNAALKKLLAKADLVIWQASTFELAISGSECFEGVRRDDLSLMLPTTAQYWSFDGFDLSNMSTDTHYCGGLIFLPGEYFSEASICCVIYVLFPLREGLSIQLNPTVLHERLTLGSTSIAALCAFMKQKIAAKEPVLLPRSERRRMARAGNPIPEISVVRLRGREASIWHGVSARKYHHSWVVRGHWRRLHEPRKSDGAPVTWIESYLKGDGPLLTRELVFSVSR